ncbi:hypothetical protein B0P06_004528 [Clostridium saccharoperbutylacetonicum]|uniref:Choloylglycine hydrolase n=1 Tax=Clostridium saccharoperbutylacetonicum N1-4(HMT) TaxID=931276 RepID=M1N0X6_9CLOT|nr:MULTISPECIES: hypothetical protein [Clostridium]AGF57182.1 hypothetical protein Cspa_c34210 [Clostridium saccharoperbutylacetonicum N1-4(HMT)]NRT62059.1 hypothetical protein [Clostridium saccharoperbutylacetonicum]NSB25389.1 hypothetical protein [Clostridium saccharoperbutylacetonicum]NSB44757.1 hypothetical protein [Clostridium saccharoperbutylacetonicum]
MCTSFIYRGNDTIIGMNFDNNGMKYSIDTKNPNWFTVKVDGGRGKYPSFGVDCFGRFFNNLVVNSNGKGLYRRPNKKVTHTTKFIMDILKGVISTEKLEEYLSNVEVVNGPDWSCHNMICDSNGNVWVVEPGRGNIRNIADSSKFFVMTNFSLWDYLYENVECNCDRFKVVSSELEKAEKVNVETAFSILDSASQRNGEWITEFSMVYSKNMNTVYYCLNGNFNERFEYKFLCLKNE